MQMVSKIKPRHALLSINVAEGHCKGEWIILKYQGRQSRRYSTGATQLLNAYYNDLGQTHIVNTLNKGAVAD
jgi:alpha-galactosidase/6-phospho-beta-glucosidase family protein